MNVLLIALGFFTFDNLSPLLVWGVFPRLLGLVYLMMTGF